MTRSPLILAAVGAALALGACGSSDDDGGTAGGSSPTASKQDKAFEGALKFAKCMREHGIDMPDPQRVGTGGIRITGGKVNPRDPKTKAAEKDCQKYMEVGGGEAVDPAKRAAMQEAALKFAKCMREHGVDMPDPQVGSGGGPTFKFREGSGGGSSSASSGDGGPGVNPDTPKFKAADEACHHYLGDREGPGLSEEKKG